MTTHEGTERSWSIMFVSRLRVPNVTLLVLGVLLGWGLARQPSPRLVAGGGDRSGESIVATGPILVRYDEGNKVQVPLDALYILDYKGGRLLGTVPSLHQTASRSRYLGSFAERDLAADFKLDLDTGPRPHFLMTTGSLGTYSGGWAPLFVFETTSNQIGIYRIHQQTVGTSASTRLELVELRSLAKGESPPSRSQG
jgi:hypothetical protein